MKFFKLLLVVFVTVSLTACSSDDDGGTPPVELNIENIAGTYEIYFLEGSFEIANIASDGTEVIQERETYEGDTFTDYNITFTTQGTFTLTGSYRETSNTTINGNTTTESEIITENSNGSYTLNTESRTITIQGLLNDVTLFDGTNLNLTYSDTDTSSEGRIERSQEVIRMRKQN